jgi:hypothetical protein
VVGSITDVTRDTRSAGKPPRSTPHDFAGLRRPDPRLVRRRGFVLPPTHAGNAQAARTRHRFFFAHLGTLISIITYVVISEGSAWSVEGVTRALFTALVIHSAYLLLAWGLGEHKQFDVVVWALWAIGAVVAAAGIEPLLYPYRRYFGALLFSSFAVAAAIPLVLGREPFTVWHAVRQTPRWQHDTPAFVVSNRVLTGFWAVLFAGAALLCAVRPTDPMFTVVYPNLVLVVGFTAAQWLPPLWFKRFPPAMPDRAEPLIMGMPFAFNPAAAGDARALIQFRVSGVRTGEYYVRIAAGRCETFEGRTATPDLTVNVPDAVWVRIIRGEVDGGRALMEQQYSVDGDAMLLAKLPEWFPRASA